MTSAQMPKNKQKCHQDSRQHIIVQFTLNIPLYSVNFSEPQQVLNQFYLFLRQVSAESTAEIPPASLRQNTPELVDENNVYMDLLTR